MDKTEEKTMEISPLSIMEIQCILPGKTRARIIQAPWKKGMLEAFRVLFQKCPNAEPISFDGHMI